MHPFPISPYTGQSGRPHPSWATERDWQIQQRLQREQPGHRVFALAARLAGLVREPNPPAIPGEVIPAAIPVAWFRPS